MAKKYTLGKAWLVACLRACLLAKSYRALRITTPTTTVLYHNERTKHSPTRSSLGAPFETAVVVEIVIFNRQTMMIPEKQEKQKKHIKDNGNTHKREKKNEIRQVGEQEQKKKASDPHGYK